MRTILYYQRRSVSVAAKTIKYKPLRKHASQLREQLARKQFRIMS